MTHGLQSGMGYEALSVPAMEAGPLLEPAVNEAYNRYIAIHKVFVGQRGAAQLIQLAGQLHDTATPDHLIAAGWAVTEASLVLGSQDHESGQKLLDIACDAWLRAIAHQRWINAQEGHPLSDYSLEFRAARDIAFLPVFHEIVGGGVRKSTLKSVFEDVLNIAQLNAVRGHLAWTEGRVSAATDHGGFGYESNALLAYNRRLSGQWFALPASSRADNGIYHREQTHDVIVVHQERGQIVSATPVEIKATASLRQRKRYASLLIRGKMHLAAPGNHRPEEVLEAITADYEGNATDSQRRLIVDISRRVHKMVGDYLEGVPRTDVASARSVTEFRDTGVVARRHPGLAV